MLRSTKAATVAAGAVTVLIVGARLAGVRPPVRTGPPSTPAPAVPQPPAPEPPPSGDLPIPPREAAPEAVAVGPAASPPAPGLPRAVAGVVLDEEGVPVEGATVVGPVLRRNHMGSCYPLVGFQVETGPDGRFEGSWSREPDEGEGQELLSAVHHPDFLPASVPAAEGAAAPDPAGLRVVLRRAAVLAGTVRDGDGRGVEGALVEVRPASPGGVGTGRTVRTDGRGEFRAAGLDPALAWEAAAESRGFRSGFLAVEPGEDPLRPRPVEISLDGLHRAEIVVRLLAPPGETLLFLDGACEGEGEPAGEGREWRAEALLGRRVVELWDGDRLRMREALDLEEAGGAAVLEVDGGGLLLLRRVPFEPPRVRRCRFPAGEEVPPPD